MIYVFCTFISPDSLKMIKINKDPLINQYLMQSFELSEIERDRIKSFALKKKIVKCSIANGDDLVKKAINSLSFLFFSAGRKAHLVHI